MNIKRRIEKMVLNKEQLRYVRLLFRLGCSNEEIVNDVIKTRIKPYLAKEVEEYTDLIPVEDAKG
jgi:hypothetical protein